MSFRLTQTRQIPELNTMGKLFIHEGTGARLLSLTNADENKCFGITFRTPPADSTGVSHIMEHSVLCGSQKYPVKEPFVEILKGSLQTFINAWTFPDKTCYPCASQNLKDFYNLVDIYMDATLCPLIPEHILAQEGWHYEAESEDAPLTYKGVVFNEMKGAFSSPDDLLSHNSLSSLFPDTPYQHESGGDPRAIPNLTYEKFKAFHQDYYHPSNAYIFMYGDDPEEERLRYLDEWLNRFEKREVDSAIPEQSKFPKPKKLVFPYDSGDSAQPLAHVEINWLLPSPTDTQLNLEFSILSHILLATPASPLKRVLIESGLGEDVIGGLDEQLRQMKFSAGLKGIQPENLDKVEKLIMDTLSGLAENGIDPGTTAASINTIEFMLREQNTGRFPRGLSLMLGTLTSWLYEGDPLEALAFEAPLAQMKQKAQEPGFFENLIRAHLLENTHRTTIFLIPDPEEGKRIQEEEARRLAAVKAGLSSEEIKQIIHQASELKQRQEALDTPEALASIPSLSLEDIPQSIKKLPGELINTGNSRTYFHDIFTNGILYLDVGFDLHTVPQDLLPYTGLLGKLLLEMGTGKQDFVRLSQRIGQETGGIRSTILTSSMYQSNQSAAWFFLRGKALVSNSDKLLDLLEEILHESALDQKDRFKQIILERKAALEAGLIPGGHGVINQRLRSRFSVADWLSEQMSGPTHLFFLRGLIQEIDTNWSGILEKLNQLLQYIINRNRMILNVTVDQDSYQTINPLVSAFVEKFPAREIDDQPWDVSVSHDAEGLTIPAQVNYVGKGGNLFEFGYKLSGSSLVINNYLQNTLLWEKIRVQGGAYGGMCSFDIHSGIFTFLSYRDPNLLASLDIYDQAPNFLRAVEISQEDLERSIIGTIGDLDAYLLPDAMGWTSLTRTLLNYDDEHRQKMRNEVLQTNLNDFKEFAKALEQLAKKGEIVILGSKEALEKANKERPGMLMLKKLL